ncbi:endonuclease/exonuclease/phosphatase family protein [Acidobacteriota bacterium]
MKNFWLAALCLLLFLNTGCSKVNPDTQENAPLQFNFENNVKSKNLELSGKGYSFVQGVEGQALYINPDKDYNNLTVSNLELNGTKDFSIQCWIKTNSKNPTVFLSQKDFAGKGITNQKNAGWALYSSGGTFAWSIGSGSQRIEYERDNGKKMPVNDGQWHQLTLTYKKELSQFCLYYDGHNKATYNVGFDFTNNEPLVIGSTKNDFDYENRYLPEIESGAKQLQVFVDEFNSLGLESLKSEEFIDLIVNPERLYEEKLKEQGESSTNQNVKNLEKVLEARKKLMPNPYTVFQNKGLTNLKPISKIYSLKDNKVVINKSAAKSFTMNEKLFPSDFAMDQLSIWEKVMSAEEVMDCYSKLRKTMPLKLEKNLKALTVGVWNIWHGGKHFDTQQNNADSRLCIAEILKKYDVDVILMQETYSSGDFIAADLGYYFATTSDRDYCYQGANISVISRYPIKEIKVSKETEFNNVAVRLAISKTQEIYAMSNWYGMAQFPAVFDFHKSRFDNSDKIPILFGGDFNAVPHTDGGKSPASEKMLEEGFTDAFRSLYPDVQEYPGYSHRSGRRIDQLYYKGQGLKNTSTKIISSWPTGFPSDHFLILSKFDLNYSSVEK